MKLQFIDYIPWIGSVIGEVLVVVILLKQKLFRRFPLFSAAVVFDLAREIILPGLGYGTKRYAYSYWISIPIEYVIAFGVMLEAFRYSLGADPRIPTKTLRIMAVVALLLVAIATFLLLRPDIPAIGLRGLILALDRSIGLLRCGVLLFIWAFARHLGISWRHHVWGIIFGLGLYAGIGLIAAAVHALTGNLCGDWPARATHYSYFAATIIWAVYLWRPEPERGPLTLERIEFFNNSVATYRKILAQLWRSFLDDGNGSRR